MLASTSTGRRRHGADEAEVISRDVEISAQDGRTLAATLYEPQRGGEGPFTAIAAGAGISRRYYGRFATYLAEHGRPTVTFDYRDIGGSRSGSLKGSKVRMRDWCILDVPGVLAWAAHEYPGRPIHWVGHSMGGFATGLAHNNHLIARQLNIATLNGYWRRMAVPERYRVRVLMGMAGPPIARALGYFPGALMGGEDMPAPAFIEWVGWCMTPDFLFSDETLASDPTSPAIARPFASRRSRTMCGARRRPSTRWRSISEPAWITRPGGSVWPMPAPPRSATTVSSAISSGTQLWPAALAWLDGADA